MSTSSPLLKGLAVCGEWRTAEFGPPPTIVSKASESAVAEARRFELDLHLALAEARLEEWFCPTRNRDR